MMMLSARRETRSLSWYFGCLGLGSLGWMYGLSIADDWHSQQCGKWLHGWNLIWLFARYVKSGRRKQMQWHARGVKLDGTPGVCLAVTHGSGCHQSAHRCQLAEIYALKLLHVINATRKVL